MKGFASFLRKEAVEILRTWRIWVLPGIVLFFAVSGPPLAKYTPELLKSLGGTGGMQIIMTAAPDALRDSYAGQWMKNLGTALIAVLIMYGGLVASERSSGTAILVLTKPVSRRAFVVAKYLTHAVFIALTVSVGALVTWGLTAAFFDKAPFAPLALGTAAWIAYGMLALALMTLLSVLMKSPLGAGVLGVALWGLSSVLGFWEAAGKYSPIGLGAIPAQVAAGGHPAATWPVVTSLLLSGALVALAAELFKRQEL